MTGEWLGVFSANQIIPEERSNLFRRGQGQAAPN
jgi:hypothetical protein